MRERQSTTQTMTSSRARSEWGKLLDRVAREKTQVVVEKGGVPVAAIISTDDLARYRRLEEQRDADFAILDEIGALFKDEDPDVIEREVARAIAEVRAENPIQG